MCEIDYNEERAFEDRKDLLEQQDREARGVHVCPFCYRETSESHYCIGCGTEGCAKCLVPMGDVLGRVCGLTCAGDYHEKAAERDHERIELLIAQRDALLTAVEVATKSDSSKELIQYHLAQVSRMVWEMT